ncbi:MAG: YeeE/YedE family protein, partial [Actinobacteria bacterium]|nr:YeeE/YedE family protein [Actinomycetota bacterium]
MGRCIINKTSNQTGSSGSNLAAGLAWTKKEKIKTLISALVIIALLSTAYLLSSRENPGNAPISLMIGVSLGLLLERGRFCFFCIYREGIEDKNTTPFLAILVAIASGSIGYSIIFGQFLPDTSTQSLPPAAHIGPVSWPLIVAALAFGLGMSLSGACISGHLYRIGQGYLRAIPALIGVLIGFVIAFLTWNWLYLKAIADAPTIWLP